MLLFYFANLNEVKKIMMMYIVNLFKWTEERKYIVFLAGPKTVVSEFSKYYTVPRMYQIPIIT